MKEKWIIEAEQKPKTGHWIWDEKSEVYRCSRCNHFPWRVDTSYQDEIFEDLTRTNAYNVVKRWKR